MSNLILLIIMSLVLGQVNQTFAAGKGVVNFGKVNDALYRGAQPDALALQQLKALGVRSIINLRMTNDIWKDEPSLAQTHAMSYTNIPLNSLAAPSEDQLNRVLNAIQNLPKPVFIHCQFGCDRTGTIVACYRIHNDQWSNARAFKEAESYGFSPYEAEMREFIMRYKKR